MVRREQAEVRRGVVENNAGERKYRRRDERKKKETNVSPRH